MNQPDTEAQLAAITAELADLPEQQRDAALATARRLLDGDTDVVDELATQLADARVAQARARAGLRQAARMIVAAEEQGRHNPNGEQAFARRVGVDRQTVRGWLDKR